MATKVHWSNTPSATHFEIPLTTDSYPLHITVAEWLRAVGFRFLELVERRGFARVLPPPNWSVIVTRRGYRVVDRKSRSRALVHLMSKEGIPQQPQIKILTRYNIKIDKNPQPQNTIRALVTDVDATIYATRRITVHREALSESARMRAEEDARHWLMRVYPDWRDPLKYW